MTAFIDPSARTILGSLTTTFTPPATCTVGQRACPTCNYAWEAQTCYSSGAGGSEVYGVKDATQCWPPTSSGLPLPTPPLWGWGFYSPGIICPTGYTSECSATEGSALTWTPEWSLAAGETAVGCCPSQYACTNNQPNVNTCVYAASSTSVAIMTCEAGTTTGLTNLQVPFTVSNTADSAFILFAPLIQINWQSTDLLSASATKLGSSTATIPSNLSPTGSSGQSTSSNTTSATPNAGLPTGAIAGIAIGASLVVIALAILLFLVLRKPKLSYGLAGQYSPTSLHELNGGGKEGGMGYKDSAPACSHPVSEMSTQKEAPPAEIYNRYDSCPPVELDARSLSVTHGLH